ncbi:phosphatidylinositol-specific phospholipase C1-like protein [Chondrinema litorale]|uniref:phosphatidylinositol-specific phospholipase C1-like protein n=1 Tax=Chondrinema litorale TaxID=2994555 RepID=UPI00254303D8|nr:phosphatidylinositol-specific phospholipase C1-like protein [Chondrinema litorale]UZR98787.1 phosphatidylinositol-specific phospholipase C1-like protein [Chondrinema litorale]
MKLNILSGLSFLFAASLFSCNNAKQTASQEETSALRINQIQVIGSHNSYKPQIEPPLMEMILAEDSNAIALDYRHVSLSEQLDLGLRKVEIDVLYDPQGGRFAKPMGLKLLQEKGIEPLPFDTDGELNAPGFKVLHIPDIDFRTSCYTLASCLEELKQWSAAHPKHLPIAISFNAKTGEVEREGFAEMLPFTKAAYDSLDAEILSVLPAEKIIRPDDVRGDYATLEEAVLNNNWPLIEDARGKFMFVLDEGTEKSKPYIDGHPSLKDRVMFVKVEPGKPEAGFVFMNDPVNYKDSIKTLVAMGYIVRTRADANTTEAREGDYSRFEDALESGAQFISTDYYLPDERLGTGFQIKMPDGVIARCNPINTKENCKPDLLEPIDDHAKVE